jgi:hypothetical protein
LHHHIDKTNLAASYIIGKDEYLALSSDKKFYFSLTHAEILECDKTEFLICQTNTAVLSTSIKSCNLGLLQNDTRIINKYCNLKVEAKSKPSFKRLPHNENMWTYCVQEPIQGVAYCPTDRKASVLRIDGTGILELRPGCLFTCDDFILYPLTQRSILIEHQSPKIILQSLLSQKISYLS